MTARQKWALYNEIDPYAAQWIRNLMAAGLITDGEVDERSIEDVMPDDVKPFRRFHAFAGIAVWDYALNQARWGDQSVWTGSCPCQPFSAAGKQQGTADERHLWPVWFNLIRECRPAIIFGEQVEAAINHGWLDLVQSDLEGKDYAFGTVGFPACGVGAPHIRQRLWFMANASQQQHDGSGIRGQAGWTEHPDSGSTGVVGDAQQQRLEGLAGHGDRGGEWAHEAGSVAETSAIGSDGRPRATSGFWRDADWLRCRDERWRPVEPGTQPLANGITARVGKLRAYGNAICAPAAKAFIEAAMEYLP
jgi:DNA (cytosine-5)-methyltransferase 1